MLDTKQAKEFHTLVIQRMFLANEPGRMFYQIEFLATQVRELNQDNWAKLTRIVSFISSNSI